MVYDPHNLYQFIWYYCSDENREKKWDALCLPNGYKGEYMHTYCERADIFDNVYRGSIDFSILPIAQKLKTISKMLFYYLIGKKEVLCKKMLSEYVDIESYDEIIVIADVGLLSGACVALGKEKKVVILEDGSSDYGPRPTKLEVKKWTSFYSWQGFILSKMGYCSPGWFRLKSDEYCIKYCSHPEKMLYKNYKEMRLLYDYSRTNTELFDIIIRKIYPEIESIDLAKVEAIVMTRPLEDFVVNCAKYRKRFEDYIANNYKNVLIKKHPREKVQYSFGEKVLVEEIDNSVPAEVLLPYFEGKDIIIISTSTIIMYLKANRLNCTIIDFDGLHEESVGSNTSFNYPSNRDIIDFCNQFLENDYIVCRL